MCGLAGWISGNGQSPDREVLTRVTRALAHRGPDAEGIVIDGVAGFGHRRLSIIDLSASANQPMRDASGRYLIVFNGEIYNFAELRRELEVKGHGFNTHSDSEVLLEAIKAWGPAALERVVGMFALALWDTQRQTLLLARDRLGKKPLFFAHLPDGGLLFASEPRALATHPGVSGGIDPVALANYLSVSILASAYFAVALYAAARILEGLVLFALRRYRRLVAWRRPGHHAVCTRRGTGGLARGGGRRV